MNPAETSGPFFVIVGIADPADPAAAVVLASTDLRHTALDLHNDYLAPLLDPRWQDYRVVSLATELGTVAVARGADYPSALQDLLSQWQPGEHLPAHAGTPTVWSWTPRTLSGGAA